MKTFRSILAASFILVLSAFAIMGVSRSSATAPAPAAVAPLKLWVSCCTWEAPGQVHTAALYCTASDRDAANVKILATLGTQFPGCKVTSIKTDAIPDGVIQEVFYSRRLASRSKF